uniref:Uncharacterized protein n=1 Tax=Strongyloides papillosus TaxID=174720 RepID=A0A0N5CAL6_STREA
MSQKRLRSNRDNESLDCIIDKQMKITCFNNDEEEGVASLEKEVLFIRKMADRSNPCLNRALHDIVGCTFCPPPYAWKTQLYA